MCERNDKLYRQVDKTNNKVDSRKMSTITIFASCVHLSSRLVSKKIFERMGCILSLFTYISLRCPAHYCRIVLGAARTSLAVDRLSMNGSRLRDCRAVMNMHLIGVAVPNLDDSRSERNLMRNRR